MKVVVTLFSILVVILSRCFIIFKLLWVILFSAVFCIVTTYVNKYKRKLSYFNDFPNVLRVFFGCSGGALLSSYDLFEVILGLLLILFGILANDESIRRVYRNKGLIVLSGIDGTGKSTHTKNICRWLKHNGIQCRIVRFHRYLFLDRLSKFRLRVRRERSIIRQSKNVPYGWIPAKTSKLSFIRPYLALLDNVMLYLIEVIPALWKGEYVVCDRFLWDNYVKHKMLGYYTRYLFRLSTIVKPKIGIILDLPSEIAVERVAKRNYHYQYTVEQYEFERIEFRKIGKKLGYIIVNTNQPSEKTWQEIENYLISAVNA